MMAQLDLSQLINGVAAAISERRRKRKESKLATLKEDIIESWYFETQEAARDDNKDKAKGYAKVVNGVLKDSWGDTDLKWCWLESNTEVE